MRKFVPGLLFALAASVAFTAATLVFVPFLGSQESPQVVEAKGLISCDAVRPGQIFKVAVLLKVQAGYHINDNAPLDQFLIPTELSFGEDPGFEVVEILYPRGRRARFAYSEAELVVYEGEAVLGALIKAKEGVVAGTHALKGSLSYQACNNESCLPPKGLPFEITVPVTTTGTCAPVHPEIFDKIRFKSVQK